MRKIRERRALKLKTSQIEDIIDTSTTLVIDPTLAQDVTKRFNGIIKTDRAARKQRGGRPGSKLIKAHKDPKKPGKGE